MITCIPMLVLAATKKKKKFLNYIRLQMLNNYTYFTFCFSFCFYDLGASCCIFQKLPLLKIRSNYKVYIIGWMDQHEALVKRATQSLRVTTPVAVTVCLLQIRRMRLGTLLKGTLLVNDRIGMGNKHSTHFSVSGWRSRRRFLIFFFLPFPSNVK